MSRSRVRIPFPAPSTRAERLGRIGSQSSRQRADSARRFARRSLSRRRAPAFTLPLMDLQASLVPADYVDPAVFAAELRNVLRTSWLPVGRVDQLPQPGDHLAATVGDEPVLFVRDADGEAHVF